MNAIKIFSNEQFGEVRTATIESGDPLFCLADICNILDIKNVSQAKTRLNQNGVITNEVIDSMGRTQDAIFVTESNLYKLAFQSRKKEAEQFTEWVTSEVLPSIRKSGGYIMTKEEDSAEIIMARAILVANEAMGRQKERIAALEKEKEVVQKVLEHQAPIFQYANEVLSSKSYHTVTTIGAQFGLSGIILNRLLVKANFIRKTEGEYSLCAPHFGKGYTFTKTSPYFNEKTSEWGTSLELRYTEVGRMKIHSIIERAKVVGLLKTVRGRLVIDSTWKKTETNA
jgi:anti-repressor protein